jgi:hypothetical protein
MWTTSSFRASAAGLIIASPLLAGCAGARVQPPPDSPRPQVALPAPEQPGGTGYAQDPVELRAVSARRVQGDTALMRMAGRAFLERAADPIAIDVRTRQPLGELARDAAPLVYLNGERIEETRVVDTDRLVAFLPDRTRIRPENLVAVAWIGSVQATMTRAPLTLLADEIQR